MIILSGCMIKHGKYVDDNPIEEIIEQAIKSETGLDLDLTPRSPEKQREKYDDKFCI